MDVEKFINLVYGHKCLWDQSDSSYHLRDQQRKAWRDICKEMGIPVDELKKKWRGLRDTFGKELRKHYNKSGQPATTEPDSNWIYFKHLLFLRSTMSRRDLKSSVADTCEIAYGDETANASTNFNNFPGQSSELDQNSKCTLKKKVKRRPNEIDVRLLEIEEEKLKCFLRSANDHDAQFLMSLLPFLKDIPKHRKLMVRAKLQQVLLDEQNDVKSAVSP